MAKQNYLSTVLLPFLSTFILMACSDNNAFPDDPQGVAVERIDATMNFNLEHRQDWTLSLGSCKYNYTVTDNTLSATANGEPFRFRPAQTTANGSQEILLCSPLYGSLSVFETQVENRAMSPILYIGDQTTEEKLTICDELRGPYVGNITSHLQGITLYHMNALLDFTLTNIPDNAEVTILSKVGSDPYIKPWRNGSACKVIVLPYCDTEDLTLCIKMNNRTYKKLIPWASAEEKEPAKRSLPTQFGKLGNSTWLQFEARINAEDELVIEHMNIEFWSSRWPLTK